MTLPPSLSRNSLSYALNQVQNYAAQTKDRATSAVAVMAAGPVDTNFVFNLLDALNGLIAGLNAVKTTAGGYVGTMTADITATIAAAQASIDWVVANFPASGGFLLGHALNADGTRTSRTFTSGQTAGFRTALNNLLATIG